MGYSTSWPGPWYVASPPRSVRCSSKGGAEGSKRRVAGVLPVPSVYTGACCSSSSSSRGGGAAPASSAARRRRTSAFCQAHARTYGTCGRRRCPACAAAREALTHDNGSDPLKARAAAHAPGGRACRTACRAGAMQACARRLRLRRQQARSAATQDAFASAAAAHGSADCSRVLSSCAAAAARALLQADWCDDGAQPCRHARGAQLRQPRRRRTEAQLAEQLPCRLPGNSAGPSRGRGGGASDACAELAASDAHSSQWPRASRPRTSRTLAASCKVQHASSHASTLRAAATLRQRHRAVRLQSAHSVLGVSRCAERRHQAACGARTHVPEKAEAARDACARARDADCALGTFAAAACSSWRSAAAALPSRHRATYAGRHSSFGGAVAA